MLFTTNNNVYFALYVLTSWLYIAGAGALAYSESRYVQTYSFVFNHRVSPNPARRVYFNPFRMEFHALREQVHVAVV